MGERAEQLGRAREADLGVMDTSVRQLSAYSSDIEPTVETLRAVGSDTGIEGASSDAAADRFAGLAREVAAVADYLSSLADAGARATTAIVAAKTAYANLPDGELTFAERAGLTAAATVALPGFGTVTGIAAGEILSRQREQEREARAAAALRQLDASMGAINVDPPRRHDWNDFTPGTGTTAPSGPTGGTGGRSGPDGWTGTSGSGGRTVGTPTPTPGGGTVDIGWTPGGGSGGGPADVHGAPSGRG
ncbi:MAG: hypothetical protein IE923_11955, partial [Micrococcales bacterium]|nr:hypothetical protein [Micrococcales bacterium]